jgi:hypothetical protein
MPLPDCLPAVGAQEDSEMTPDTGPRRGNTDLRIEAARTAIRLVTSHRKIAGDTPTYVSPKTFSEQIAEYREVPNEYCAQFVDDVDKMLMTIKSGKQTFDKEHLYIIETAVEVMKLNHYNVKEVDALLPLMLDGSGDPDHVVAYAMTSRLSIENEAFKQCSEFLQGLWLSFFHNEDSEIECHLIFIHHYTSDDSNNHDSSRPPHASIFHVYYLDASSRLAVKRGYIMPIRDRFYVLADISDRLEKPHPAFLLVEKPPRPNFAMGVYAMADKDGVPWASKNIMIKIESSFKELTGSGWKDDKITEVARHRITCALKAVLNDASIVELLQNDHVIGINPLLLSEPGRTVDAIRFEVVEKVVPVVKGVVDQLT